MLLLVGLIGLLSAQECQAPPEQDGLMYYCADGVCISICNDDRMVPLGGLSPFTCADYPNGDYPFPTSCGHPCQEPASGPNLNQECTDTVSSFTKKILPTEFSTAPIPAKTTCFWRDRPQSTVITTGSGAPSHLYARAKNSIAPRFIHPWLVSVPTLLSTDRFVIIGESNF